MIKKEPDESSYRFYGRVLEMLDSSVKELDVGEDWQSAPVNGFDLDRIVSKLRYGGRLRLFGVDAREISRVFFLGGMTLETFDKLIRSKQMWTMQAMVDYMTTLGLTVIEKSYDEVFFHLTFERKINGK